MKPFERVMNRPGEVWQNIKATKQALPTNAWYFVNVLRGSIRTQFLSFIRIQVHESCAREHHSFDRKQGLRHSKRG